MTNRGLQLSFAPLRGVTGYLFRTVFSEHFGGFDYALAPFIPTAKGTTLNRNHCRDILPENNPGMPVVPQFIGKDPSDFLRLSGYCAHMGYTSVNWNLGCPAPQVVDKERGSGMLPHPDLIDAFFDKICPSLPVRLSVKVRLGLDSPRELRALMPVFNRYPLEKIIIHARTGRQMYEGTVDIDAFAESAALSAHPVVYNGDITGIVGFQYLVRRFPEVREWMIGRGAVADPFLPVRLRNPAGPGGNEVPRMQRFHDTLVNAYCAKCKSPVPVLGIMKELWAYWSRSFVEGDVFLRKVLRTKRLDLYRLSVEEFFLHAQWTGVTDVLHHSGASNAEREGPAYCF